METLEKKFSDMVGILVKKGDNILSELTPKKCNLWHMATGIAGEAGELLDAVKKNVAYNKPLDIDNVIEELGDLEFYMEGLRNALDISRDQTLEHNYNKLMTKRYPDGVFSNEAAIARADKVDPNVINWGTIAPGSMITNGKVSMRFSKMISPEEFEAVSNDEILVTGSVHGNWKFKYVNSNWKFWKFK